MADGFDVATGEILAVTDYKTSTTVNEIFGALAKAQGEIRNAVKDSANPHFKSRYADLASVSDACRGPLSKNGIAVVQIPHNDGRNVAVTTILGHSSGQFISGKLAVAPAKWDAQGVGSVTTYLRRYGLAAMAGVAPGDDDDGEAAVGRGTAVPLVNSFITDDEVSLLETMLTERAIKVEGFLAAILPGARSLCEIPRSSFAKAKATILDRDKKLAERKAKELAQ